MYIPSQSIHLHLISRTSAFHSHEWSHQAQSAALPAMESYSARFSRLIPYSQHAIFDRSFLPNWPSVSSIPYPLAHEHRPLDLHNLLLSHWESLATYRGDQPPSQNDCPQHIIQHLVCQHLRHAAKRDYLLFLLGNAPISPCKLLDETHHSPQKILWMFFYNLTIEIAMHLVLVSQNRDDNSNQYLKPTMWIASVQTRRKRIFWKIVNPDSNSGVCNIHRFLSQSSKNQQMYAAALALSIHLTNNAANFCTPWL